MKKNHSASATRFISHKLYDQENNFLGMVGHRKASWYIKKNLVAVDSTVAVLSLKLLNPIKNRTVTRKSKVKKPNRCVVCGAGGLLSGHHLVPRCFSQFLPRKYQLRNSHDVLPICHKCHVKYEGVADIKKREMCEAYGADFDFGKHVHASTLVAQMSRNYFLHAVNEAGKLALSHKIGRILKYNRPANETEMSMYARLNYYQLLRIHKHYGLHVMEQVKDLDVFAKEWREHFVKVMSPKFMHLMENWRIDRRYED